MAKRLTLDDCRKAAEFNGGECLSTEYFNDYTKMEWKCSNGHIWFARLHNIRIIGQWCKKCRDNALILDINIAYDLAAKMGGACISKSNPGGKNKLLWKCKDGHQWPATLRNIKNGTWCPFCRKISIKDAQSVAQRRGGECLSTDEYCGANRRLTWRCKSGHSWKATYNSVANIGSWCRKCLCLSIEDARCIANENGGKCLSDNYKNCRTPLLWECSCGFTWSAKLDQIKNTKTWCPKCATNNKVERRLFDIIAKLLPWCTIKTSYKKFRWLKTRNGGTQEFDIWVPELKLAIEYDGEQHFKPVCFGGCTLVEAKTNFDMQKRRDRLKNRKTKEHKDDVDIFIRIPYTEDINEARVAEILRSKGVGM